MKLTLNNLVVRPYQKESLLIKLCEKKLHAPCQYMRILKKSLDARDKSDIKWVYTVECSDRKEPQEVITYEKISKPMPKVYIVGAGPCGLFCALRLLDHGIRPVVLERGQPVEERTRAIEAFQKGGALDTESNVQFGEGGAGTFSDGKLNTQTNSPLNREVLRRFVELGAPAEVEYLGKPHVGSDRLKTVVLNARKYILDRGGEVRFGAKLTDIECKNGKVSAVFVNGVREEADEVVLAVGHSARDTFEMLLSRGLQMEQKEFAVGVRIEHLQSAIGWAQYGSGYAALPPADYKLVSHASDRAVFTFCMCPGGVVILATSEEGGVVTNGMSNYARDERNANSALIAQVRREDFKSEHPLAGIALQREIERAAYVAAGSNYCAPVQLVGDFLADKESYYFGEVRPSYARGTAFAPLQSYLPKVICDSLKAALPDMGNKLYSFASYDAVLTGVESRTSSPVRILREKDMQAAGVSGIYPAGEGCGYAGGITSAAADGLRAAQAIAQKYM
ncbi:MAG: NAD(P)/FAD-dependent oxidoreductase [Clostridiales bacterium]|nr:NAD(P)/FAD-dependent oxidoreductase [Clostridiales bacterium]